MFILRLIAGACQPSLVKQGVDRYWHAAAVGCVLVSVGGILKYIESSVWQVQGAFALELDPQLAFSDNGEYGLDSITFGPDVSVSLQVAGIINTTDK